MMQIKCFLKLLNQTLNIYILFDKVTMDAEKKRMTLYKTKRHSQKHVLKETSPPQPKILFLCFL